VVVGRTGGEERVRALLTSNAKWLAGPVATDLSTGSSKMTAKAKRRRRVGGRCGSAALMPPRAGNGGTGDPLVRRIVCSVCTETSIYTSVCSSFSIYVLDQQWDHQEPPGP